MNSVYDKYVRTRIANLFIVAIAEEKPHNHTFFICKCAICGSMVKMGAYRITKGKISACQKCKNLKQTNPKWTGYKDLYGRYLSDIQRYTRNRSGDKAVCNISLKYLYELYIAQDKKCAITGVPIEIIKNSRRTKEANASIDRIDSELGYIEGNVQWITKEMNRFKNHYSMKELLIMCNKIVEYNKDKIVEIKQKTCYMNAIKIIYPYRIGTTGWAFDDEATGLVREPFVSGIPEIIDVIIKSVPEIQDKFKLYFSETYFPDHTHSLTWVKSDEYGVGNYYQLDNTEMIGWLCPALFRYYVTAPEKIYCKVEGL